MLFFNNNLQLHVFILPNYRNSNLQKRKRKCSSVRIIFYNKYRNDQYEYFDKDKVVDFMVGIFNYGKKIFGIRMEDGQITKFVKIAAILFILSAINGLLGNYWFLFIFINGFFGYNYLYATKKDLVDGYYAKAMDAVNKGLDAIPKYQDN